MTITPALVFEGSGSKFAILNGVATEIDKKNLYCLNGPLPDGMVATYIVTTTENGEQVVSGVVQARSVCGRRYFSDSNESAAQHRILKWAQRILKKLEREELARRTA